jgi:Uma2 family endonuclease
MYTGLNQGARMSAVMNELFRRHRITVDEYYRMAEEGILPPDARVELIEGEVIDMAPIGTEHGSTVTHLSRILLQAVGDGADVRTQQVVRLSDRSEPQPDISLVKLRDDFYKKKHPGAEDALLLIEVSETSLRYDLEIKASLYARYKVPEYWVVDLQGRQFRLCREPKAGQYTDVTTASGPGIVTPVALPGVQIDLTRILGD